MENLHVVLDDSCDDLGDESPISDHDSILSSQKLRIKTHTMHP